MSVDELEVVELNGVRIVIDPAFMSERLQKKIRGGRLSQPEARFAAAAVERGDRFVELGGGIGYTSSLVARRGLAESVTTFEPNPEIIPAMRRTHAMNGVQVEVVHAVVMARKASETVPFFLSRHFNASSLNEGQASLKSVDVPVMSFAEMKERFAPTMLMVDIEGAELSLFQGIDLAGVRKVLVELHKGKYGPAGVEAIHRFFAANGFVRDSRYSRGAVVLFRRPSIAGRALWPVHAVIARARKLVRAAGRALRRRPPRKRAR